MTLDGARLPVRPGTAARGGAQGARRRGRDGCLRRGRLGTGLVPGPHVRRREAATGDALIGLVSPDPQRSATPASPRRDCDRARRHEDGLRPGHLAVRVENARPHVALAAGDVVLGGAGDGLFQDAPALADELNGVLGEGLFFHRHGQPLRRRLHIRELHARRRVEVAGGQRRKDRLGREAGGPHDDPALPGSRRGARPRLLQLVHVVARHAEDPDPGAQHAVPQRLDARVPAAAGVVHHEMAVVNLDEVRALSSGQVRCRHRPAEVGMVD